MKKFLALLVASIIAASALYAYNPHQNKEIVA